MELIVTYLIAGGTSIIGWILTKKHLLPIFMNWWNEYKNNKLKYKTDLQSVEEVSNNIYSNQIKFLNSQIDSLQDIIKTKSDELKKLYDELSRMRTIVKNFELKILDYEEDNITYLKNCCSKKDCPMRTPCQDVDTLINKYMSNEHKK